MPPGNRNIDNMHHHIYIFFSALQENNLLKLDEFFRISRPLSVDSAKKLIMHTFEKTLPAEMVYKILWETSIVLHEDFNFISRIASTAFGNQRYDLVRSLLQVVSLSSIAAYNIKTLLSQTRPLLENEPYFLIDLVCDACVKGYNTFFEILIHEPFFQYHISCTSNKLLETLFSSKDMMRFRKVARLPGQQFLTADDNAFLKMAIKLNWPEMILELLESNQVIQSIDLEKGFNLFDIAVQSGCSTYILHMLLRTPNIFQIVSFATTDYGFSYRYGAYAQGFVEHVLLNPTTENLPYGFTLDQFIQFVNTIPYCQTDPNIQSQIHSLYGYSGQIGFVMR